MREGEDAIPDLLSELQARGFKRSYHQGSAEYLELTGAFRTSEGPVQCRLEIDRTFRQPPRIFLTPVPDKLLPVAPHLGPNGQLCYAAKGTYVFDIYDPVRQTLALISRAEQVLDSLMKGEMREDLAEEFFAYWGECSCFMDVEGEETKPLQVYSCDYKSIKAKAFFLTDNVERTSKKLTVLGGEFEQLNACVFLISSQSNPRPSLESWPPQNLGQLLKWQRALDHRVPSKILKKIRSVSKRNVEACMLVISSPGFKYGFMVAMPTKQDRKFLRKRSMGNQHLYPLKILQVAIIRVDDKYLTERNLPAAPNLARLKITIIGCGTIGGYLAELAVKAGAGTIGGHLELIDPDRLGPNNLGRHRLGFGDLHQYKASALVSEIKRVMPSANISALSCDARDIELADPDLIIDATGDESLGYWIAGNYHRNKPILSVWIEGGGVAVRSLLNYSGSGACYRCLCDYNRDYAFRSVKEEIDDVFVGHGCEELYVPFPATVSLQAACLGMEAAMDWAGPNRLPTLRTKVISPEFTSGSDDCCPVKRKGCPACCN
ncbi:ThiF family adenylyltransferase [Marinobacter salarius]|jgi:molybdopterin/thiamine biosynthesis adenylyltransferase|uniref:ThiF family adenylyltransferase n=1 Tax=Marinobacter salarius TaxID=1420917 RepID=UPI000C0C7E34|nr:MAG: thiamine biosynthesis protein ThiF [Leeuwenhoekiella sp.]|tara:strand:+ start:2405 stop:4045 length:1641 start_codon:yes stop_codon:yes gene_type:complete